MPSALKTAAEDAAAFMHERWLWVMSEKQREREYVRDTEMMFILLKTIPYPHLTDTVVMSLSTLPIQPQRDKSLERRRE